MSATTLEVVIIAMDSSVGTSVAVTARDGVVRAELSHPDPRGHAEVIGDLITRTLAEASVSQKQITHVACGMGPGPFTGLRVGIAAARAFAWALEVPVLSVVSHDAVALHRMPGALHRMPGALSPAEQVIPFAVVTDARRGEYAYSIYTGLDGDGLPVRAAGPRLCAHSDLGEQLRAAGAIRVDADAVPASGVARAAVRAIASDRVIADNQPLYLRSPDVTPAAPAAVVTA